MENLNFSLWFTLVWWLFLCVVVLITLLKRPSKHTKFGVIVVASPVVVILLDHFY